MPRTIAFLFALAALVAAGAFAYSVLRSPVAVPMAPSRSDSSTTVATLLARVERLEAKTFAPQLAGRDPQAMLDELRRRLETLEQKRAAAPAVPLERETVAAGRAPQGAGASTGSTVSVQHLDEDELLAKARATGGDLGSAAAAPYWREVILRRPSDAVLVEAQYGLGLALRAMKDHEAEEAAFLEAARTAGSDAPRAQEAIYQVAWSRYYRDDFEGARQAMEDVAAAPATPRNLTGHARLNGSHFALKAGDAAWARDALETVLRDFEGSVDPMHAWFVEQAEGRLEALDPSRTR